MGKVERGHDKKIMVVKLCNMFVNKNELSDCMWAQISLDVFKRMDKQKSRLSFVQE